jgi:hypothetical protein
MPIYKNGKKINVINFVQNVMHYPYFKIKSICRQSIC